MMLRLLSLLLLIALFGQLGGSFSELPETMATHFDGSGAANGWMSKSKFTGFMVVMGLIIFIVMGGLPTLSRGLPARLISIPRRDYWLAPEREQETLAFLERHLAFLGIFTLSLLIAVTRDVIAANMISPPQLPAHISWQLISYMAAVLAWVIILFWHFWRSDNT